MFLKQQNYETFPWNSDIESELSSEDEICLSSARFLCFWRCLLWSVLVSGKSGIAQALTIWSEGSDVPIIVHKAQNMAQ